jgi:hypothetical protein
MLIQTARVCGGVHIRDSLDGVSSYTPMSCLAEPEAGARWDIALGTKAGHEAVRYRQRFGSAAAAAA